MLASPEPYPLHREFSTAITTGVIAELIGVPPEKYHLLQDAAYTLFDTHTTPAQMQAALAPRFYALTIRDETRPRRSLWAGAGDDTLRGLFLQALKAQYDAAPDEAARRLAADAARLGLAAMDGREAPEL